MILAKRKILKKTKFDDLQKFVGFPVILFIFILIIIFFFNFIQKDFVSNEVSYLSCGDGTPEGNCSINKPYYCINETLVENVSFCSCPENFTIKENSCYSLNKRGSKKIMLNYVLHGEEKVLSLTLYREMNNYLLDIPEFLEHKDGESPTRQDFELRNINEKNQRELLLPLITEIQNIAKNKDDQARIAISLVQQIPFGFSDKTFLFGNLELNCSRFPYNVLWDYEGICSEKSQLLVFLLKELGFDTVLFYHHKENHEAVGIKCPEKYSYKNTGYCFIETTGASILSNSYIQYVGGKRLESIPEVIPVSDGISLSDNLYEYQDAKLLEKIHKIYEEDKRLNLYRQDQLENLNAKYFLEKKYYSG